jgi:DNA-binding NtrC family response regulator
VLEEKRFRRVGGGRELKADFRLIAATNRDLTHEVENGRFREDLFYRLNVVRIHVPALRERKEDIPFLAELLLRRLGVELGVRDAHLTERAMKRLVAYEWPGNVRELKNTLERAILVAQSAEIRLDHLAIGETPRLQRRVMRDALKIDSADEIRPVEEIVSSYIDEAIRAVGGNMREAARRLGLSRSTLYARMGKRVGESEAREARR